MVEKKYLISCPIFKDELELVLPASTALNIRYMDYRIHNDGKRMFEELQKAVASVDSDDISILVGRECYCEMSIGDFAESINAKLPDEKNCIEMILGHERTLALQQNRTTIHTHGWMRMIHQFITEDSLNADSIRIMIGHFDRILLLDYGIRPFSDEDILSYYDLLQVPIEIESVRLEYFKGVLDRLLV